MPGLKSPGCDKANMFHRRSLWLQTTVTAIVRRMLAELKHQSHIIEYGGVRRVEIMVQSQKA